MEGRQGGLTGFLLADRSAGRQQNPRRTGAQRATGYLFPRSHPGSSACKPHPHPVPKETNLLEGEREEEEAWEGPAGLGPPPWSP